MLISPQFCFETHNTDPWATLVVTPNEGERAMKAPMYFKRSSFSFFVWGGGGGGKKWDGVKQTSICQGQL